MSNRSKGKRQRERQRRQLREQRRSERRASAGTGPSLGPQPNARSAADPICGVASPTIDPSLCWYIAKTTPRMGVRALEALQAAEVVTYQPRASEVVVRRGRRVVRRTPMLIRTVFIGVKDELHLAVARDRPGVAEIVCYPVEDHTMKGNIAGMVLKPARLDAVGLQLFVDRIAKGEIVEPVGVKVGQSVMVIDGPYASFPATVDHILSDDSNVRVIVSMTMFGKATPIELNIAQIQPLG